MKKRICLLVIISLLLFQFDVVCADGNERTYIHNNEIQVLSNGLYYFIGYENYYDDELNKIGGNYSFDKNMFFNNCIDIDVDNFNLQDGILASNENINIKANVFGCESISILYSENADINIECDEFQFRGLIYAPNGKVTIKSKSNEISGSIICKEKEIDNMTCIEEDEKVKMLISFLERYKNEGYMRYDAYFDDNGLNVYCDASLPMNKGKIFARKDNEMKFSMIGNFEKNEGLVNNYDFNNKLDVIVEGETVFGEKIESKLISFFKNENDEPTRTKVDSDEDGVEDGIEIFYLKSDPNKKDSDNDGIEDGVECYLLGSDPVKYNDPEEDFDNDGVTNIDEIAKKTNPFLPDSDFDGVEDNSDDSPILYSTDVELCENKKIHKGRFDKEVTYVREDGKCIQKVYDFVNENCKLEVNGEALTTYYYNKELKLASKILSYNDEISIENYEYEGNRVKSVYRNGYKYNFEYDGSMITGIGLNDVELVSFNSNKDSTLSIEKFANGYCEITENDSNVSEIKTNEQDSYKCEHNDKENSDKVFYNDSDLEVEYYFDENDDIKKINSNQDFSVEYSDLLKEGDKEKGISQQQNISYKIDSEEIEQKNIMSIKDGKIEESVSFSNGNSLKKYLDENNNYIEEYILGNTIFRTKLYSDSTTKRINRVEYGDNSKTEYEYDFNNCINKVIENGKVKFEYQYDDLNRLNTEINYNTNIKTVYEYDLYDNICCVKKIMLDNNKKISEDKYEYDSKYKDQLVKFNEKEITYDENGKPLKYYDGSKMEWCGDKLTKKITDDKEIELYYDSNGILIKKLVNGIETIYNVEGKDFISETTNDEKTIYLYDESANIIGFINCGKTYYYIKNVENDIIKIVDEDNNVLVEYDYDAWGNINNIYGNKQLADKNKFRYRSYYYDTDMKMYYLQTRYYDTSIRRFISTDKAYMLLQAKDNMNLYAYCNNNPILYSDKDGKAKNVTIFSVSQFREESFNVMDNIIDLYQEEMNEEVNDLKIISDKVVNYGSYWNNLSGQRIVIFNTHGNPLLIGNRPEYTPDKKSYNLTIFDLQDTFEYKYVSLAIVLGCSSGHYNYWYNVGATLSTKVSGFVIASDGGVESGFLNTIGDAQFDSIVSMDFIYWCAEAHVDRRDNMGWLGYKDRINNSKLVVDFGLTTLTMKYVYKLLEE